jgi:hypothetical protein
MPEPEGADLGALGDLPRTVARSGEIFQLGWRCRPPSGNRPATLSSSVVRPDANALPVA